MKGALKSFLITAAIFAIIMLAIPSISVSNDPKTFILVAFILFLVNFFVRPLLKLAFFLPLNLLTFNVAGFAAFFAVFLLLPNFLPNFKISYYDFGGVATSGIIIPAVQLSSLQAAAVAAFIMSIFSVFLGWVFD
ncbi:hypothetical protein A2Z23_00610 [Candidatus Curtissbacteria bacterium RBG_16_39_7]|uniref:Uncharacterized protein n=1 Tax=Candidatus Curtissbacteria bacterium RBG_16_39_7 TaxID=1797707 RepID=A0A1F5G4Q7_9BACT|nr:MAG: hypothetical protein A2Z23_00610 [Candidatus Curtissbacteria bacterium RBG_16_39_7]